MAEYKPLVKIDGKYVLLPDDDTLDVTLDQKLAAAATAVDELNACDTATLNNLNLTIDGGML